LIRDDKKQIIVNKGSERKYKDMLAMVNEPDKIKLTQKTIIPAFLFDVLNR
jgi:hypothetical protein